jgi:hypothetical protein
MNYLVSYNHSGNTLVRYYIELLTGLPTIGHNPACISDRFDTNFLNVDKTKSPILIKRHEVKDKEISINDKFIFLLRDDEDCIKKNYYTELIKYNKLKRQYLTFKGPRLIIFYHEILTDILGVSKRILQFIEFKETKRTKAIIDTKFHNEKSLSIYRNPTGQPSCKS